MSEPKPWRCSQAPGLGLASCFPLPRSYTAQPGGHFSSFARSLRCPHCMEQTDPLQLCAAGRSLMLSTALSGICRVVPAHQPPKENEPGDLILSLGSAGAGSQPPPVARLRLPMPCKSCDHQGQQKHRRYRALDGAFSSSWAAVPAPHIPRGSEQRLAFPGQFIPVPALGSLQGWKHSP